jgi:hypothetical protein
MKRLIYIIAVMFVLSACDKDKKEKEHNKEEKGEIFGTILYQGARDKRADFLVTMQREKDNHIYSSERTTNTGEYRIKDLPAGTYKLTASGWGTKTKEISSVIIPMNGKYDIDMELIIVRPQIFQNGIQVGDTYDMTETPSLNFDILNGNRVTMDWWVEGISNGDWISVHPENGSISQGEQNYAFTIKVEKDKLQNANPAIISFNSNRGSFSMKVNVTKKLYVTTLNIEKSYYSYYYRYSMKGIVFYKNSLDRPMEVGFYYSKNKNPKETGIPIVLVTTTGYTEKYSNGQYYFDFSKVLDYINDNLEKKMTYYVQAYAKNRYETAYGDVIPFLCDP